MGSKRASDPLSTNISAYSGSADTFKEPKWKRSHLARHFKLGDLVTLAPEFRYSITSPVTGLDFGRYVGIVIETFSNREYMVVWTIHPLVIGHKKGMFNGDHLIKVENADKTLMGSK